jgi:hypothetical protein
MEPAARLWLARGGRIPSPASRTQDNFGHLPPNPQSFRMFLWICFQASARKNPPSCQSAPCIGAHPADQVAWLAYRSLFQHLGRAWILAAI